MSSARFLFLVRRCSMGLSLDPLGMETCALCGRRDAIQDDRTLEKVDRAGGEDDG
jgi:hypothetical protein